MSKRREPEINTRTRGDGNVLESMQKRVALIETEEEDGGAWGECTIGKAVGDSGRVGYEIDSMLEGVALMI